MESRQGGHRGGHGAVYRQDVGEGQLLQTRRGEIDMIGQDRKEGRSEAIEGEGNEREMREMALLEKDKEEGNDNRDPGLGFGGFV